MDSSNWINQTIKLSVFSACCFPFVCIWGGGRPGHLNLNELTPSRGSVWLYELCPTVSSWYFINVQVPSLHFSFTVFFLSTPLWIKKYLQHWITKFKFTVLKLKVTISSIDLITRDISTMAFFLQLEKKSHHFRADAAI